MSTFQPPLNLILLRTKDAMARLAPHEWSDVVDVPLEELYSGEEYLSASEAGQREGNPVSLPHRHGKVFDQTWFRLRMPELKGNGWWLRWQEQGEATLFHDGEPYCGFDVAHREFELSSTDGEFLMSSICVQSAIWHPEAKGLDSEGSRIEGCKVARRNETIWKLRVELLAAYQLLEHFLKPYGQDYGFTTGASKLPDMHPVPNAIQRMMAGLYEVLNELDASRFDEAQKKLDDWFTRFRGSPEEGKCVLTGHAHVDLVWLWPERVGEQKAIHSFATANYLMERYPNFHFGYSQPHSYQAVERDQPGLMKRVDQNIATKRWEATGALWVESDTLVACGEALMRSFKLGQQWFKEKTGAPSEVLWLPDCFGFSANLPQIAKLCDVKYFFTMKTGWRVQNRFPLTSFRWRGIDGSELIGHTPRCIDNFYNSTVSANEVNYAINHHPQGFIHNELLMPAGYGDGGGGVTEEQIIRAERMSGFYGFPTLEWGRIDEFFHRLEATHDQLPLHSGEISIEHHRGVYTTHHTLKALFRDAEKALQAWEAVRALNGKGPVPQHYWERLVFAQFHDYIPGSSIMEVYDEAFPELAKIAEECREQAAAELGQDGEACLFNSLPEACPATIDTDNGPRRVTLPPVSGLSVNELAAKHVVADNQLSATNNSLSNNRVSTTFNADGEVESLLVDGQKVEADGALNQLWIAEDKPHNFSAWDVDLASWENAYRVEDTAKCVEHGQDEASAWVVFERSIAGNATRITYRLSASSENLEVDLEVDWQTPEKILRAVFPTRYRAREAHFGAPYGVVKRSQVPGEPQADSGWEVAGSRWGMAVNEAVNDGLFLASESKYGFGARDGRLSMTLLRSCRITGAMSEGHSGVVPTALRRRTEQTEYADLGQFTVRYVIGKYDLQRPHPASVAATAFTLPLAYNGESTNLDFDFSCFTQNTLQPEWLTPTPDGWELRAYERGGASGEIKPGSQAVSYGPYEIITVPKE